MSAIQTQNDDEESTDAETNQKFSVEYVSGLALEKSRKQYQLNPDDPKAGKPVLTPTGKSVRRVGIAGVIGSTERVSEMVARATIHTGCGASVRVYANQYTDITPTELTQYDIGTPVKVIGKVKVYTIDDDPTKYLGFDIESMTATDKSGVMQWRAETANQTKQRISEIRGLEEPTTREEALWLANYDEDDLDEIESHATEMAVTAINHFDPDLNEFLEECVPRRVRANLIEEFDTVHELREVESEVLLDVNHVGQSRLEDIQEAIEELH